MKKIIEINVEMPYHSEVYAIGKEAYIDSIFMCIYYYFFTVYTTYQRCYV